MAYSSSAYGGFTDQFRGPDLFRAAGAPFGQQDSNPNSVCYPPRPYGWSQDHEPAWPRRPRGIIKELVMRITLFRIVAVLLLLIAGAEVYACDISDVCVTGAADPTSQQSSDCDQPTGDFCLCCCHHVVPVATFVLEPAERLFEKPAPPLMPHLASQFAHIDHPPQL